MTKNYKKSSPGYSDGLDIRAGVIGQDKLVG